MKVLGIQIRGSGTAFISDKIYNIIINGKKKTREAKQYLRPFCLIVILQKNVFFFILIELLITLHFKPKTREHSKQA